MLLPRIPTSTARRSIAGVCTASMLLWCSFGWSSEPEIETNLDEIVVTATRSPTLIRDEPLRVEAVPAEEIEENLTIQPGNVSTLLKELPGAHFQSSAPALGGAVLQLRGMPGRNTLVLTDGLPLLGSAPDAFGLLQIPPLDLARVEVIKGTASALYGGSGLGGVLNLVSQTPDSESAALVNVTSRGGRDLMGFLTTGANPHWSGTVIGGAHDQSREDVDGDGWADIAGFRRYTLRPRIWWDGGQGHTLLITAGIMDEDRQGGTMPGQTLPVGGAFPEALRTTRFDIGAVSQWTRDDQPTLSGRYSVTSTDQQRTFGVEHADSTQTTAYIEQALNGTNRDHRWVLGLAFEYDKLATLDVPDIDYTYYVPAAFVQDTYAPKRWLTLAASARVDANSDYGTFLSPRLSALLREPDSPWSLRASLGSGFTPPTPFVDEIAATWAGALLPLHDLNAERAVSASIDGKWARDGWDVNVSVFTSKISNAIQALPQPGDKFELINASGPRRAPGVEILVGYVEGPLHALASWSEIHATEVDPMGVRRNAALVPRQTATLDAILENEQRGRIGFELEYTGRQALDDNPYRSESAGYLQLNALAELRFGGIAVFFNAINLTDVRQTNYDPLLRPTPGPGGNPVTEAWAPLAGRTFNIGIRAEL
ncbi:MAG: TonB-dependent receptor [Pseudomonadota bacterium]